MLARLHAHIKKRGEREKMEETDLYGYRHQIVRVYWNKGLTEEELSEIMRLPLRVVREMVRMKMGGE